MTDEKRAADDAEQLTLDAPERADAEKDAALRRLVIEEVKTVIKDEITWRNGAVAWANVREDGAIVGLSQHSEDIANWQNPRPLCYQCKGCEDWVHAKLFRALSGKAKNKGFSSIVAAIEYAADASERADAEKDATLTDEQILSIWGLHEYQAYALDFARAILAAKEKKS